MKATMRKLIVYPSDPIQAYIAEGKTYEYLEKYFNPSGYFDEVYAVSPWGELPTEQHGKITYIKEKPRNFQSLVMRIDPTVGRAYGGYCCADWLAMSRIENIPTVVSVHDTNPSLLFSSLKYADNIISMAQCVQDAVREKIDCSDKGEWVMGNRIDTSLFSYTSDTVVFRQLNEKFGNGRHILHVGRKADQKNLDTLIRALPLLPKDISAIFIGRGDFTPYEQLALELGVSDRIFNIESVKNAELPKWYSWCDCFCTPSRWEGFGYVFIEAAGCKAPIVTSDISPMNEYLTSGKDSILVKDYEDPKAIADAIRNILDNPEKTRELRGNARKVGERFSKESVDAQEIAIYEEIIRNGPRRRVKIPLQERIRLEWKYR